MEKRPLSLTIIAWVLIVLSLIALIGVFTINSNAIMVQALQQMHMSVVSYQIWVIVGVIVDLIVAYGILKGQPWSRVLYVVWGVIGLVVGFYIMPQKAYLVISIVVLIVISIFLFSEKANEWFSARGLMLKRERS